MAEFVWSVSRSGYDWDAGYGPAGPTQQLVTYDTGEGVWTYYPMKVTPDLFLKFAALDDDSDYLPFAAQYGQLTCDVTVVGRTEVGTDFRERVSGAVRHSHPPSAVVRRGGDSPQKSDFENALRFPNGCNDSLLDTSVEVSYRPENVQLWCNQITEMKILIRTWRTQPDERCQERVRRGIEAALAGRAVFAFDLETGQPSLAPIDLLSALWLQFAFAVGGAREYRACQRCATLFPVSVPNRSSTRRSRSDKRYCTMQCQMDAAYDLKKRKRQKVDLQAKKKQSSASLRKPGRGKK